MNQYTLDYSDPQPNKRSPNRRSSQPFRQAVLLTCALICGTVFVLAIRMRADARFYQINYKAQAIRYDSLMAAKAEADRQLQQLRSMLSQTSLKP